MKPNTRKKFNAYQTQLAQVFNIDSVLQQFTPTLPMQQRINGQVQKSDAFLARTNLVYVDTTSGEIVTTRLPTSIAGRTDTKNTGPRQPQVYGAGDGYKWFTAQTDYDVALEYKTLDNWASRPNFVELLKTGVHRRKALDILMIGWYGTSIAADTDRTANPLLEDVNKGWLQKLRERNPANMLSEIVAASGKIKIGPNGDFKNIDHFVSSVYSLIPEEHRTGDEMAIMGSDLLEYDKNKILALHGQTPTEKNALQVMAKSYAGLEAAKAAHFPARGLVITDPMNLQHIVHEESMRRHQKDEPEYNRVTDFNSQEECWELEDKEAIAAVEFANVVFEQEDGSFA